MKVVVHVRSVFSDSRRQPVRWRAALWWQKRDKQMTTCAHIGKLIATAGALLDIDEALRGASMLDHAERVGLLSAEIRETARGLITGEMRRLGDPSQKAALLGHAIELDGVDSSLVAQAAAALSIAANAESSREP